MQTWQFYFFIMLTIFITSCGVERPSVSDLTSTKVNYGHTGQETSCSSCHDKNRPTTTDGFLNLNVSAPFNYAAHGGTTDCAMCHSGMTNTLRSKSDWGNGYYQHTLALVNCSQCHNSERPILTSTGSNHPLTGDCSSCHQPSLTLVSGMSSPDYKTMSLALWKNANGKPTDLVWDSIKDNLVTIKTPNYDTYGIFQSWTNSTQTLHMYMNHNSTAMGTLSCTDCHSNSTSYSGGRFHSSVTVQPNSCVDCHNSTYTNSTPTPDTNSTTAFVGPMSGKVSAFNHASTAGLNNCSLCHQQSNWSAPTWNAGIFHRTNDIPTTCSECHKPTRPSGLVSGFNHSLNGTGECVGCHGTTKTLLSSKSGSTLASSDWSGAVSTPTGLVGQTSLSISAVKLVSSAGVITGKTSSTQSFLLQMDHGSYNTTSCTTCHTGSTYSNGSFHANIGTQPTTCNNCHTSALEGFILGSSINKPIDHNHTSLSSKDCSTCHSSPSSTNSNILFKDGSFHTKLLTQPTSCKECHSGKILDQPVWGTKDHSTIGSSDCISCHTFPGTGTTATPNWKGAMAHTKTFLSSASNSCVSCHQLTGSSSSPMFAPSPVLTGNVNKLFAHSISGSVNGSKSISASTCLGCHSAAAVNALGPSLDGNGIYTLTGGVKTQWVGTGTFSNHKFPSSVTYNASTGAITVTSSVLATSCMPCHATQHSLYRTGTYPKYGCTTGTAAMDCVQCHTTPGSWNQNASSQPTNNSTYCK